MEVWKDEIHEGWMRLGLRQKDMLFEGQSAFQKVTLVDTEVFGRALLLDDIWQTAEGDQNSYHEMIVHPALVTAKSIEKVLIIGGGDGGTALEVLRHPEVKEVDLVEIDAMVVDACQRFLTRFSGAWDDPRLKLHVTDGLAFVGHGQTNGYDVIIVDGSDPIGPAEGLFQAPFYADCRRCLTPGGVLVTQSASPTVQTSIHLALLRTLRGIFKDVHPYYGSVGLYPAGAWSWTYATDAAVPTDLLMDRVERVEAIAEVYNRDVHLGSFAVPNHVKKALQS